MKKIFLFFCAITIAAACSAPTTNTNTPPANTATSKSETLSEADLIAKEKEAWTTLEKKNYTAFGDLLDTEYVEVGDAGVYNKAGVMDFVKDLEISTPTFSDWKLIPIDDDAVLITYNVTAKTTYKGKPEDEGPFRATGGWVKRNGKWVGIYFQETLAEKPNATPPPPEEAPAKSNELPAKTPAETTADPVANEKAVWDALKRKDYDAFGNYLDEASIEVEANGVFDKAGSIKGARLYDFSKWEISDFKTLSIDSDASLVTYVVKSSDPKMPLERHTTIWVKRDGKWRALFHQGTPEKKPAATTPEKKTS
jgi:hypothetical protein